MRYRFGNFLLVLDTRELLADGQVRPLEPQVFDLLRVLIQARDHVVTQDELVAAIWQGRSISDSAISARISAARTAIGDDGRRQLWIRTLPKKGFRFVGDVEAINDHPAALHPVSQSARQKIAFCRSTDGTRLAYGVSGAGYPLVRAGHWLTHLELDWHSPIWRPHLDELNRHFHLLRYDQRGNGLSEWQVADLSLDRFVDDLEAVVDAAGFARFALYGASQGAAVALGFARRHPHRVSHLILHGGYERGRLLRDGDRGQGEAILTLMRHGWGRPDSPFIEAFSAMFIPDGARAHLDSLAELQRRTTSAANAAALRAAFDSFDVSALLPGISVPTLVIHARDDGVQPIDQGYRLAAQIPGAEFLMLESRNHVILSGEKAWQPLYDHLVAFVASATVP